MLTSHTTDESPAPSFLLESVNNALRLDDAPAARRLCEMRLAEAPDDPDAHRYLGHVLILLGE
ncbi:MAG: hypothetical protein L0H94_07135, partial [Nitrospira sp.]|nr:hypothetical protein [Nitrospira sp.]